MIEDDPEIEIGAHVAALRRYDADDGFEVTVKVTADGEPIEFVIPTDIDGPADAIEAARTWLLAFAAGITKTFAEPNSLE